ncbi:putative membrane protein [Escherichia coli 2-156-04_S3_C2]|nr:putative membrane protein [Escherichia coli 2-156-04_S3_C2]
MIVAPRLVALSLLVVSPLNLGACFYNYSVKVPVQPVPLVF